jgi:Fe-S cluster assembly protein SufB
MSCGLSEDQATSLLIAGFVEPTLRELTLPCADEINHLIALDMTPAGAVGQEVHDAPACQPLHK